MQKWEAFAPELSTSTMAKKLPAFINKNNYPAVMLQVKFEANGQLAAGLPVKINIADD